MSGILAGRPQHLHGNGHDDDRGGHPDASFALGAIGMEDELVRARISHMAERLDDVASLKNDFAQLLEPIAAFAAELPQLKAKLLETESMLAREREGHGSLAQQIRGLKGENLKLQDQLGGLSAHNNELRERSKEQEAALAAIRRDLREKEAHAAELERQIRGETERAHLSSRRTRRCAKRRRRTTSWSRATSASSPMPARRSRCSSTRPGPCGPRPASRRTASP